MSQKSYAELCRDPRWQKKRLEIMQRDGFKCCSCDNSEATLNVHHKYYVAGRFPWEYPGFCLITLCDECHKNEPKKYEDWRQSGVSVFDDWERGLDHFGDKIFDMAADEVVARVKFKWIPE